MSFQFILGSSGSGKTEYIYNSIIEKSNETDETIIILVPEQFTLQTQQDIVNINKAKGIMNIEVLSFQRLAYRIFDDLQVNGRALLKETGKSMIIRKIVKEYEDKFSIINKNINKKGYVKELKSLITEYYQYNINNKELENVIENCDSELLKEKLLDTMILYKGFKNYIQDKYLTTETTLDLLCDAIKDNKFLDRTTIYIDGFYGFTPIQYKVIEELLNKINNLFISITIDSSEDLNNVENENELFYESKKAINTIRSIAYNDKVIEEKPIYMEDSNPYRFINSPCLGHLEKNLYRYPYNIYEGDTKNLYLCQAPNLRKEVKYVADSIMKLVMENDYRYKDIAVVTGDMEGYEHIIKHVFYEYDIPYFVDKKNTVMTHPLVELVLSLLNIINTNFSYESIFTYLKTGLVCDEYIDILENYVLAYGIRGSNRWNEIWDLPYPIINNKGESEYANEILDNINIIKDKIITPINNFKTKITKNKTISEVTKAIYEFLEELDIENKIKYYEIEFEQNKQLILYRQYSQIYKMVIELLDQTVDILGDEVLSIKDYKEVLEAGFMQCEIGIIPPSLDQVVIGDLERTRIGKVKALFVIGLNEGKIPNVAKKPNLITDSDREKLLQYGMEIAPDNKRNIYKEQFSIYMGLLRPNDKLFLSFSNTDITGKSIRPSILFITIKKMFKKINVVDVEKIYEDKIVINKPKPTLGNLIDKLKEIESVDTIGEIKEIYTWFKNSDSWKGILDQSINGINHNNKEEHLSEEITSKLYGNNLINSVSRLELFSRCPFSHFVNYGLNANDRLEYSVSMPEIGILFHTAIEKFFVKLNNRDLDIKNISDETRDVLVEEAVKEIISTDKNNVFLSSYRNKYILKRLIRITKRAIWAIQYQILKGDFRPSKNEFVFNDTLFNLESLNIDFGNNKHMKLTGVIDRVDEYEDDENVYVTVIDYKSGSKKFDMENLYYGLQMQLIIYLNATIEINKTKGKGIIPAGVFYFKIHDPIIKKENISEEGIDDAILSELKLKGIVLDDIEVIRKIDKEFSSKSDVIPVSLTKDGKLSKNSSVISSGQFEKLQDYVKLKSKEIGEKIINGDISINPYKKKSETACDYCKYISICQFEDSINGQKYNYLNNLKIDQIFKQIEEDLS